MSNPTNSTRQVCFRISASEHEAFTDLLAGIPGAEAGNLYRAIFSRGLKALQEFYGTTNATPAGVAGGQQ